VYKSTQSFIADRQIYARNSLKVVHVDQRPHKDPTACCQNAIEECDQSEGVRLISGWTVKPIDPYENTVAIVQHWWNQSYDSVYYDTTRDMDRSCEYVTDLDLLDFAASNPSMINNNIAISLLKIAGNYYGVDEDESGVIRFKIPSLDTPVLYRQTQFLEPITFKKMPTYSPMALCR